MISSLGSYGGNNASSVLQKFFSKADANADTSLSKDELIGALGKTGKTSDSGKLSSAVDELVSSLDSDSNGSLSSTEFSSFASQFDYGSSSTLLAAQEASGQGRFQPPSFGFDGGESGAESASGDQSSGGVQAAGGQRPPHPMGPPPGSRASNDATSSSDPLQDLYSSLDSDGSGGVNQDELSAAVSSYLSSMGSSASGTTSTDSSTLASELFTSLDSDSDGSVSQDELGSALKSTEGQRPPPPMGPPPANDSASSEDLTGSSSSSASASSSATASTSYDPLDTNQDGEVSAEERMAAFSGGSTQKSGVTSSRLSSDTLRFLMSGINEVAA